PPERISALNFASPAARAPFAGCANQPPASKRKRITLDSQLLERWIADFTFREYSFGRNVLLLRNGRPSSGTAVAIYIRLLNHAAIPQSAGLPEFSLNHSVSQAVLPPAAIRHPSQG